MNKFINGKINIQRKVLWIAIIAIIIFIVAVYIGIKFQALKKEVEDIRNQQTQSNASMQGEITSEDLQQYSLDVGVVYCYGDNWAQGSGILWTMSDLEGLYVITNRHVITGDNCHIFIEDPKNVGVSAGRYKLDTDNIKSWNNKTDVAFLKILYQSIESDTPLSSLSSKVSGLAFCSDKMPIGAPVAVVGYPAFAQKIEDGAAHPFQAITQGTISAYDNTVQYSPLLLPDVNYFISAKMDSGNSGGIAFSKDNNKLCILGIPTWISIGNYETQGMIQSMHNVIYIK